MGWSWVGSPVPTVVSIVVVAAPLSSVSAIVQSAPAGNPLKVTVSVSFRSAVIGRSGP